MEAPSSSSCLYFTRTALTYVLTLTFLHSRAYTHVLTLYVLTGDHLEALIEQAENLILEAEQEEPGERARCAQPLHCT